ncbi:uncharacterized protein LOC133187728 isoform X2 [Saccostrea echinata]|uniref:uncharacterized protein LOC133187728 isoform X2 n=1 Tax=Saccostrea echinata TaxID=191078 RepID=UPI002A82F137|nr:uncharacterized protein LOC133187728 isoform X2 [Saccostrea echinata]
MEEPIPAFIIAGSVIGGIFLLFLTVIIFTCRRRQQIERELDGDGEQDPIVTSAAIVTHHPPPPLNYGTTNPGFKQNNTIPYPYPSDVQNNPYPVGYNPTSYPTNQGAQYPGYQTNYAQT